jgi:hypothetical protein
MKKETTKMIYTDSIWKSWETTEKMREEYGECHELSKEELEEIDDETIFDWCHETLNDYWNDFKINLGCYGESKQYLILANLGLWDGQHDGGKIVQGLLNSIWKTLEDTNTIYEDGRGVLKVEAKHHDGTNHFTIYELTEKGEVFAENNCYMDDRELHQKIFDNKNYRRNVNLIKKVYG